MAARAIVWSLTGNWSSAEEPWIAGRYLLDTGATVEAVVEARLVEAPLSDPTPSPVR